ncbi:MAG: T9SS type A sorting domain-containing protein [Bacteroidetes bacterium]|nr:T9SS type A sorting domain-containing protein [Bacteroidota bacterium]
MIIPLTLCLDLHFATSEIVTDGFIYITNALGQDVITYKIENNTALIQTIPIPGLSKGLYHFTLSTELFVISISPFMQNYSSA